MKIVFFNKLTNLQQRTIAGILGAGTITFFLTYNEWTYFGFVLILSFFTQREFYSLIREDAEDPLIRWGLFNGVLLNVISFFVSRGDLPTKSYLLFFALLGIVFISELYRRSSNPFENIAFTILGVFYVAMPLSLLHFSAYSTGSFSPQISIGFFLLLWAGDTGAYFAGKYFGKHKLFQRISPNKTWEGVAGGIVLSLAIAHIMSIYFSDIEYWKWYVMAIIIPAAGTYGDLIESMLKRSLMVKDSGNLIPGHGGLLDRFDGLLLAAPFSTFFLMFF
ncbi:MAG: phosphatidate cytidylyltransferase [Cytophagales bacterium]|nr:phosphatidate cytidylyltransferase [Cytophagales bacterium]